MFLTTECKNELYSAVLGYIAAIYIQDSTLLVHGQYSLVSFSHPVCVAYVHTCSLIATGVCQVHACRVHIDQVHAPLSLQP